MSAARSAGTRIPAARTGKHVATAVAGASAERPGQQVDVIVDRRVPKASRSRPANHTAPGIWSLPCWLVVAVATGIYESERLVSAFGEAHLFATSLWPGPGVYECQFQARTPMSRRCEPRLYPPAAIGRASLRIRSPIPTAFLSRATGN